MATVSDGIGLLVCLGVLVASVAVANLVIWLRKDGAR